MAEMLCRHCSYYNYEHAKHSVLPEKDKNCPDLQLWLLQVLAFLHNRGHCYTLL